MIPVDLLYFVRSGERNEELRYSLRTIERNFPPGRRVWIVGDHPSWCRPDGFVKGNLRAGKWENGPDNLRLACEQLPPEIERFVVMNDDFFVLRPVEDLPFLRRDSKLADQVGKRTSPGPWHASLAQTLKLLRAQGFEAPWSYELHQPVVMERLKLLEAVRVIQEDRPRTFPAQWRTVYGNWFEPDAPAGKDRKTVRARVHDPEAYFDSSDDRTFRGLQRPSLERDYPNPSRWEGPASRLMQVGWVPARERRNRRVQKLRR